MKTIQIRSTSLRPKTSCSYSGPIATKILPLLRQQELVERQQKDIVKLQKSVKTLQESSFEQDVSVDNLFNKVEANGLKTTHYLNTVDKRIADIRNKLSS